MRLFSLIKKHALLLAIAPAVVCVTSATAGLAVQNKEEKHKIEIQKRDEIAKELVAEIQLCDSAYTLLQEHCLSLPCTAVPCEKQPCEPVPCLEQPSLPIAIHDTVRDTIIKIKNRYFIDKEGKREN